MRKRITRRHRCRAMQCPRHCRVRHWLCTGRHVAVVKREVHRPWRRPHALGCPFILFLCHRRSISPRRPPRRRLGGARKIVGSDAIPIGPHAIRPLHVGTPPRLRCAAQLMSPGAMRIGALDLGSSGNTRDRTYELRPKCESSSRPLVHYIPLNALHEQSDALSPIAS